MQRLREAAEKAKIELSGRTETTINLPFVTADASGPKHLDLKLSRGEFNKLTADLVEKTLGPLKQALNDSGLKPGEIDQILLVGGSTRIPAVQDLVKSVLNKEPNKSINPDEVVAVGAAIQAGVLGGEVKDVLLLDVTPLSLGIETLGGVFTKLIERNTTIPTRKSETFSTAADNQTSVEIHVLQGEREMAAYNKTLGKFQLVGIPPAPRGIPKVEVTFDIDANGIVNVSAKDLATSKSQQITITATTNLTEQEIQQMVKDSEKFAEEDKKKREEVDARNHADQMVYTTEKSFKEYGDKLTPEVKNEIEAALKKAKDALEKTDIDEIKKTSEALMQASHKMAQVMYEQAAASQGGADAGAGAGPGAGQSGPSAQGGSGGGDDDVVDAEYKDI